MLGAVSSSHISLALEAAKQALLLPPPNPRVGCVLAAHDGTVIGTGHTQKAGGPHAEIMALRDAAARSHSTVGATAYVTLEPCSHHGRTGPCCDALIAAGVSRVVATNLDPNPLVAGRGFEKMRAAGVSVEVLPMEHPDAVASRELNIGFFSRMVRKRPWVRLKTATSLDGFTALPNGQSQWITGEAARADGHAWRARACAVLTGVGTVLSDDPLLDVRHISTPRQPHLVVLDSGLRTPVRARLLPGNSPQIERKVWIYALHGDDPQHHERAAALQQAGAEVFLLPAPTPPADGWQGREHRLRLGDVLADLAHREVNELHVEAGHTLNTALWRGGWVDELLWYQAPVLLGRGLPALDVGPWEHVDEAPRFELHGREWLGSDWRLVLRRRGADQF